MAQSRFRGSRLFRNGVGAACLLSLLAPVAAATADDARQLVDLPPVMRTHMLGNMRDHLAALLEIQQALAAGDFSLAGRVAEQRIGVSSLTTHGASHMAPYMPAPMQEIGTAMHRAASQFAVVAEESAGDADLRRALGALAGVTRQCVACHAAYRAH